jgi:hypothetical protein
MQVNLLGKAYRTPNEISDGGPIVRFSRMSRPLPEHFIFRGALACKFALLGVVWKRASQASVQLSDHVPEDYQSLWDSEKKRIMLCQWKDTDYFHARYRAVSSVKFFSARQGGRLRGLAATVRRGHVAYVAELLVEDLDVSIAQLLKLKVLAHHLSDGARAVQFLGHDQGFFRSVFSDFHHASSEEVFHPSSPAASDLTSVFIDARNWSLTTGDAGLF